MLYIIICIIFTGHLFHDIPWQLYAYYASSGEEHKLSEELSKKISEDNKAAAKIANLIESKINLQDLR